MSKSKIPDHWSLTLWPIVWSITLSSRLSFHNTCDPMRGLFLLLFTSCCRLSTSPSLLMHVWCICSQIATIACSVDGFCMYLYDPRTAHIARFAWQVAYQVCSYAFQDLCSCIFFFPHDFVLAYPALSFFLTAFLVTWPSLSRPSPISYLVRLQI